MDEAERFATDRRRYRLHAASFLGAWGSLAAMPFVVPSARPWLLVTFAALLVVSGVLAVMVRRTLFSHRVEDTHAESGDALMTPGIHTGDLAPSLTNATAPVGLLVIGVVFLATALVWALR